MNRVTERKLSKRVGTEGPRDDPYAWDALSVTVNGVEYRLRLGALGYARYYRDGELVLESFEREGGKDLPAVLEWEAAVGMSVRTFEDAYCRVHCPHFEDPMGSIGDYA